jgi:hypothetical protein
VEDLAKTAERLAIDLSARGETLTVEQFAALADAISGDHGS